MPNGEVRARPSRPHIPGRCRGRRSTTRHRNQRPAIRRTDPVGGHRRDDGVADPAAWFGAEAVVVGSEPRTVRVRWPSAASLARPGSIATFGSDGAGRVVAGSSHGPLTQLVAGDRVGRRCLPSVPGLGAATAPGVCFRCLAPVRGARRGSGRSPRDRCPTWRRCHLEAVDAVGSVGDRSAKTVEVDLTGPIRLVTTRCPAPLLIVPEGAPRCARYRGWFWSSVRHPPDAVKVSGACLFRQG
jgi:hypothetical protein